MLPFAPSDLPWWEWLSSAGALIVVAALIYANLQEQRHKRRSGAVSLLITLVMGGAFFACAIAFLVCAIYGLIRLSNLG